MLREQGNIQEKVKCVREKGLSTTQGEKLEQILSQTGRIGEKGGITLRNKINSLKSEAGQVK
jgi:hypothetical protein